LEYVWREAEEAAFDRRIVDWRRAQPADALFSVESGSILARCSLYWQAEEQGFDLIAVLQALTRYQIKG
jgi:hypothetical protein